MSESFSEEPPRNKKVKSPSFSLSSLPDEVALSCMVLLPRSDHASLSRVSRRYRSLVASPELYDIRSQLGYSCFYVCLSINGPYSTPRWFIISREKTENKLMTPIPHCLSHPTEGFSVVTLDCGIYVIGGSREREREPSSSRVLLLDCRTHTWRQVTSMKVARCNALLEWNNALFRENMVMGEKVYAVPFGNSSNLVYYSPNEGIWGRRNCVEVSRLGIRSYCVTENVLYSSDGYGNVFWREPEDWPEWKKVKGLGTLHNYFYKPIASSTWDPSPCDGLFRSYSILRNFGMNIVIVWFKYNPENTNVDIWCAEISFERRHDTGEIVGKIEWLQTLAGVKRHPLSHVEVLHSAYVNT